MLRARVRGIATWLAQRDDHHYLGRYSIDKLALFDQYQRTTSVLRVATVILFSHAVMTFFTLLPLKQALGLSHRDYSFQTIAYIACCTALAVEAVVIPLAFAWRFPVPLREMIGFPVWTLAVCLFNFVFAANAMRRLWRTRQLQRYVPIAGVQVTLFYLFLGLSVGFATLSLVPQTVLVLAFPLLKYALKHIVWKYARLLDDISTDVAICMLEVSGALYQTVCMQFVTSPALSALIMVTDVLQAVHEVRTYVKMDYLGDGRRTLATAMTIVESATIPSDDVTLVKDKDKDKDRAGATTTTTTMASTCQGTTVVPSEAEADDTTVDHAAVPAIVKKASPQPLASVETMRPKTLVRKLSTKSQHLRQFARQASLESMRSMGITRQSSMESLRSAHLPPTSDDDTTPSPRVRLEQRVRSVYLHPTNVRRRTRVSRHKQSSRRLLDLDRMAADPVELSSGNDPSHLDEPTQKVTPVASEPGVRKVKKTRRTRRSLRSKGLVEWMRRHLRGRHRSMFQPQPLRPLPRSAKVYVMNDESAVASPGSGAASNNVRRLRLEASLGHGMDLQPSARSTQPTSARSAAIVRRGRDRRIRIDGVLIPRRHQARVLEQTLQLLFVCEVLLFAEYMEVVIPVLYSLTIAGEWLTPNAQYNVVVRALSRDDVQAQIGNALLYAVLELASLLAMYVVMKRKYGVSAFYQLAFVLETYWLTLQGKLVGAFIVVLNAVTVHQGAASIAVAL